MTAELKPPGHHALRKGRWSAPGQIYLITTVTRGRMPLFAEFDAAAIAARALVDPLIWRDSRLMCWVLMPDHWHGLVQLGSSEGLAALMQRFKANVARQVNCHRGGHDAVWSRGYHEHALRKEEDLIGVARYVVANPVRAGLVEREGDYSFWNAAWL